METEWTDVIVDLKGRILPPEEHIIYGVDPGVVNPCITTMNLLTGEVIAIDKVPFRKKNEHTPDLGHADMIEKVKEFLKEKEKTLFKGKGKVYIENQAGDDGKYNTEVLSMQFSCQFYFGPRCIPVAPLAVKYHFPDVFPRVTKEEEPNEKKRRAKQYYHDKQNAIKHGRLLVPEHIRDEIDMDEKKDDYYDSYWIARYASETEYMRGRLNANGDFEPYEWEKRINSKGKKKLPPLKKKNNKDLPVKKRKREVSEETIPVKKRKKATPTLKKKRNLSESPTLQTKKQKQTEEDEIIDLLGSD